jgi:hypothetical protein
VLGPAAISALRIRRMPGAALIRPTVIETDVAQQSRLQLPAQGFAKLMGRRSSSSIVRGPARPPDEFNA